MSITAAWVCILYANLLHGQDKICLENEVRQGKVADISLSTVRYTLLDRPDQPLLLPLHRVLILFNSDGDYLVPSQMDSTNPNIRTFLNRFFEPSAHPRLKDQVFTLQHTLLEVKIVREDETTIYWGDNGRFNKKDIAAIIYGDGKSKIFCSIADAARILGSCEKTALNLGHAGRPGGGTNFARSIGVDPAETVEGTSAKGVETAGAKSTGTEAVKEVGTEGVKSGGTPASDAGGGTGEDSATRKRINDLLNGVSRKEFEEKAEKKTTQFTDYLKVLCNKSASYEELDKAIDQAVGLFVNEDATVEVSSNNRNSIMRQRIRDYLKKVKLIQYEKIDVKWTHVQYVSDLKPGPDGNLYGTVSFEQEFRGYRDGKLVYSDVTLKHANVVLKTYNKTYEGSTRKIWDVLLSDVGVVATKSM